MAPDRPRGGVTARAAQPSISYRLVGTPIAAPPRPPIVYQRLLGHPFVYDVIRPLVVGGIDLAALYATVETTSHDVIFDVGCGTGVALDHLGPFGRYVGFDVDAVAVARASERGRGRTAPVTLHARVMTADDARTMQPTVALLMGVLHHLDDATAVAVLRALSESPALRVVHTIDVVMLPRRWYNNLLARLDRGRFVRTREGYASLARDAGLEVASQSLVGASGDDAAVQYHVMRLEPSRAS